MKMIATRRTLERSALRLVRTVYLKVNDEDEVYYLKERCYASKYDGEIIVDGITEKEFNKAVLKEERIEEVNLENARLNIKNAIRRIYQGGGADV